MSVLFFGILAVHLALHWRWIVHAITRRPRQGSGMRAGLGIVGVLAILALAAAPLLTPVKIDETAGGNAASPRIHSEWTGDAITGSMTLGKVEELTGVPVSFLRQSLDLPESVSENERLGPLGRRYGFEVEDVRRAVRNYR